MHARACQNTCMTSYSYTHACIHLPVSIIGSYYTNLMMQTLAISFACFVPDFIYYAHAYIATSDYFTRIIGTGQRLVIFLDEFLAVITGCGVGYLIGMIWIDLSLCCVDAWAGRFHATPPAH